jgi:hypothetical protein
MTGLTILRKGDFHTVPVDRGSLTYLIAPLEISFPLFRRRGLRIPCGHSGKGRTEKVFQRQGLFSTSFPHTVVDGEI